MAYCAGDGKNNNKGVTSKIMDKWYYFEADF